MTTVKKLIEILSEKLADGTIENDDVIELCSYDQDTYYSDNCRVLTNVPDYFITIKKKRKSELAN